MNNVNYGKLLDQKLEELERGGRVPTLLLHACCAPCSSYVLEYLAAHFEITVFYYNPNISPRSEYDQRVAELERLLSQMPEARKVKLLEGAYEPEKFDEMSKGLEDVPEGGERCFKCYGLRLRETARIAAEQGFDYFTTTLSISPMKNAVKLNEIGAELGSEFGVEYLFSDFKKKGGYQRSIELSKEYGLYRQDYCGCIFSLRERRKKEQGT